MICIVAVHRGVVSLKHVLQDLLDLLRIGIFERIDVNLLFLRRAGIELRDHLLDLWHQLAGRADNDRGGPLVRHGEDAALLFHSITRVGLAVILISTTERTAPKEAKAPVLLLVVTRHRVIGKQLRKHIRRFHRVGILQMENPQFGNV